MMKLKNRYCNSVLLAALLLVAGAFVNSLCAATWTTKTLARSTSTGCVSANYTLSLQSATAIATNDAVTITFNNVPGMDATTYTGGTMNAVAIGAVTKTANTISFSAPGNIAGATAFTIVLNALTNGVSSATANATVVVATISGTTANVAVNACAGTWNTNTLALTSSTGCTSTTYTHSLKSTATAIATGNVVNIQYNSATNMDATTCSGGTMNGVAIGTITKTASTLKFTAPGNIAANTAFTIVLNAITNGTNGTPTATIIVATIGVSATTASYTINNCAETFSGQSLNLSTNCINAAATWTFTQTNGNNVGLQINTAQNYTIDFPAGTDASGCSGGTYNGTAIATFTFLSATQIQFTTPVQVNQGTAGWTIVLNNILNPTASGAVTSTVTNNDGGTSSGSYTATVAACNETFTSQSLSLSPATGCLISNWTFTQTNGNSLAYKINVGSTYTVNFPAGTDATTFSGGKFNTKTITAYTIVSATQITFTTPAASTVNAGTSGWTIVLYNITNPSSSGAVTTTVANNSTGTSSGSYTATVTACAGASCGSGTPISGAGAQTIPNATTYYIANSTNQSGAVAMGGNASVLCVDGTYSGTAIDFTSGFGTINNYRNIANGTRDWPNPSNAGGTINNNTGGSMSINKWDVSGVGGGVVYNVTNYGTLTVTTDISGNGEQLILIITEHLLF